MIQLGPLIRTHPVLDLLAHVVGRLIYSVCIMYLLEEDEIGKLAVRYVNCTYNSGI